MVDARKLSPMDPEVAKFVAELTDCAMRAEQSLDQSKGGPSQRECLAAFSGQMIAIRGTALQLGLDEVASFAELAQEIAMRAVTIESRSRARLSLESLWDALTTIKYLLTHVDDEKADIHALLSHRLRKTLDKLGGPEPTVDAAEIAQLLRKGGR